MAYRQFRNEATYEAPDLSPIIDNTTQAISGLFRSLAKEKADRRRAAEQFEFDLDKGEYENDTKILTELAKNVATRAKQELRETGRLSQQTEALMKDGMGFQTASKNQNERAKTLRQNINDKSLRDPYYNPQPDLNKIILATHGEKNDVDFHTRGERLAEAEKSIGGADTFRFNKYRADYVKQIGAQSRDVVTEDGTRKSSNYAKATFWNTKTGKPEVTDDHAIDFINSEERVKEYYDTQVSQQLDDEIKKMKSSGDKRTDWMKGLSDDEIKDELIANPSKNLINKKEYGVRVRTMAKEDLSEADRIDTKVSYEKKDDTDKNNSGGRWKNPNILHTSTINTFAQQAKSNTTGAMEPVTTYGPGGRFTQKSGRPIQIDTSNPVRTDIGRGLTTKNNKGSLRMNLTGYQLMPVKKGGAPFALTANTVDGMIEQINKMPLERFAGLEPELKIGLNGYTINEAGVLGDVNDKMLTIASQIAEARERNDKEKLRSLEDMEFSLNELKSMISGDYNEQELILAANKAGIRKTKEDLIIPANESDLATINNLTAGFNLKDKSYWSPEMLALEEAYQKRYNEAKNAGFGAKKEEPKAESTTITPEEFNARWQNLKSGDTLVGPDGKTYTKK